MKTASGPPVVSLRAVAALFIARQHLTRPRSRRLNAARLTRFAEDVGGIQLDSINVVDRAHHLTVWSRFGPYDRKTLERLIYRRRALFEYWAHAACIVPIAHFSAWRRAMLEYSTRSRGWAAWLKKNGKVLRQVEEAIRERGVLGNADFTDRRGRGGAGWWNWKPAAHALDYLWMSGRTAVHSRVHFQKRFDLAERVLPDIQAMEALPREEFLLWHVRRSLHAMGAATWADLRLYLTFPKMTIAERRKALYALARQRRGGRGCGEGRFGQVVCAWPRTSTRWRRRAGSAPRRAAARCWRRSTRSSGIAHARGVCSASTIASRSTHRGTSARTATIRCPSSTTARFSAAWIPRRIGRRSGWR
jgi:hypothetical protein